MKLSHHGICHQNTQTTGLAAYSQVHDVVVSNCSLYWLVYLEIITQQFSYWPVYQAQASITAQGIAEGSCQPRAWYRADMKTPCDNLFIIRLNLPTCYRINYFICHNSLLEYVESNWWMIDRLLRVYTVLPPAATTNQRHPSLPMTWKFQPKLRSTDALALISAPGISIYNGPSKRIMARC